MPQNKNKKQIKNENKKTKIKLHIRIINIPVWQDFTYLINIHNSRKCWIPCTAKEKKQFKMLSKNKPFAF